MPERWPDERAELVSWWDQVDNREWDIPIELGDPTPPDYVDELSDVEWEVLQERLDSLGPPGGKVEFLTPPYRSDPNFDEIDSQGSDQ